MKIIKMLFFICTLLAGFISTHSCYADELIINGNRVIVKNKDGVVIDTANIANGQADNNGEGIVINEGGVSIGNITGNTGIRKTKLDNVVIINNNGKTTIFKKEEKSNHEK